MSDSFYSSASRLAPGAQVITSAGSVFLANPAPRYIRMGAVNASPVSLTFPAVSEASAWPKGSQITVENAQASGNVNVDENTGGTLLTLLPGEMGFFFLEENLTDAGEWSARKTGAAGTVNLIFTGAYAPQARTCAYTLQNGIAHLAIPQATASVSTTATIVSTALPVFLRPSSTRHGVYTANVNDSILDNAHWQIASSGVMTFYSNGNAGTFPSVSTSGGIMGGVFSWQL